MTSQPQGAAGPRTPTAGQHAAGGSHRAAVDIHPGSHRSLTRSRGAGAVRMVLLLAVVVIATSLVRSYVVAPFSIPSGSMEQTLQVGDRILVDRISYRFTDVERGDVVVFDGTDTFGRLGEGTGETDYVKRVIGLPGDHVVCCDDRGRITVNEKPLREQSYLHPGDEPSELRFDIEVPPGRLWLMGDHRADSLDSRAHLGAPGGGTVSLDRVLGRVLLVVWPLNRVGGLPPVTVGSAPRQSPLSGTEGRTR